MRAACIQLCSGTDIDTNIEAASDLITEAARDGARFIATPEMTHIVQRAPKSLFAAISPEEDDKGVKAFAELAGALGIDLLIGSLAIKSGDRRALNRSYLFGRDGAIKARYDKIHLFDVIVSETESWKESRIYDAGDKAVMCEAGGVKIGLSVCYDLRFPHLYRAYGKGGAEILTVPSAFTKVTGRAHWHVLLRARAIETGSFIIAPAQGGIHEDGRETYGHSLIINPWGDIIGELEHDEPGYVIADIDSSEVVKARRNIPAWNHDPDFET